MHSFKKISKNYSNSSSTVPSTIYCPLGLRGSSVCSCRAASLCTFCCCLCRCFSSCLHQLCCTIRHCSCCSHSTTATGYFRQSTLGLLQSVQCRPRTTCCTFGGHAHWLGSSTCILWLSCCPTIWSACASSGHSSRLCSSLLLLVYEVYPTLIDSYCIYKVYFCSIKSKVG